MVTGALLEQFPDQKIEFINRDGGAKRYFTIECRDKDPLKLTIHKDSIHVDLVAQCDNIGSGTDALKGIVRAAKALEIPKITLVDASSIQYGWIGVDLAMLRILMTGQSWYNKQGFVSDDYEAEKVHNAAIIKMKFEKFLQLLEDKANDKAKFQEFREDLHNYYKGLDYSVSTQQALTDIVRMYEGDKDALSPFVIRQLLSYATAVVKYSTLLSYEL